VKIAQIAPLAEAGQRQARDERPSCSSSPLSGARTAAEPDLRPISGYSRRSVSGTP
jgi:hypothetical protein